MCPESPLRKLGVQGDGDNGNVVTSTLLSPIPADFSLAL